MKRIVLFLFITIIATGCQKNNIIKFTLTEVPEKEEFTNSSFDGICDGEVIDYKIRGDELIVVFNKPITRIIGNFNEVLDADIIKSVEIPNSVTEIGDSAFEGCNSLEGILIPNSVKFIGEDAFRKCTSLESIEIPNSVTKIGPGAFDFCTSLESIEIPNSVTTIGGYAFCNCSSLKNLEIPKSVTEIGEYVFEECISLKEVRISRNTDFECNSFPEEMKIIEY